MVHHIKVLYCVVLFLFIVLIGEIWIYYKRLYSLQIQMNSIALTQSTFINERTRYFNSSKLPHNLQLIDLELLSNELMHFRIKRNIETSTNAHHFTDQVSRKQFDFVIIESRHEKTCLRGLQVKLKLAYSATEAS